MEESKEELKNFLMRVKEESEKKKKKNSLKLNIKKRKHTHKRLRSWHLVPSVHGKKMEAVIEFLFLGSKITVDGNPQN